MEELRMELAASLGEIGRLGTEVAAFCERNGIGGKLRRSLQLVCEEWVTNVVLHGYGGAPPAGEPPPIEATLARMDETTVRLTFVDRAPAFNPLAAPEPDVSLPASERELGGLGIHFIRKLMDRCEYERIGGCNKLVLTKSIPRDVGENGYEHSD